MNTRHDIVATSTGRLRGVAWGEGLAFLGVPFAAAPVGLLRFVPPQPYAWEGVLEATGFGWTPPQPAGPMLDGATAMSEDCLTLNVWTRSCSGSKPVLVWVYGGGFEGGTAATTAYSPSFLAASGDVVVVTLNYRVGFLGFAAMDGKIPTNLGVRDVVAALRWINANTAAFGGDPERVTVMGESAGGFIAGALMAVAGADRLCRGLILMSGAASRLVPLENTEALTSAWMQHLGADTVDSLRRMPWQDLVAAQGDVIPRDIGVRNGSRVQALGVTDDSGVGGALLEAHPMQGAVHGAGARMRLLVTATSAEISMFRRFSGPEFAPANAQVLRDEVAGWDVDPARAQVIADAYIGGAADLAEARERLLSDWIYRLPAARLAETRAAAGLPCHLAEIRGADGSALGHAGELRFLFTPPEQFGDSLERVHASALQQTVMRFVVDGEPGWDAYRGDGRACVIAGGARVEHEVFTNALGLWSGVSRP